MYLLDTDILSNLLRRVPSPSLLTKLTNLSNEQLFTSSITLGELVYGAYKARTRRPELLGQIDRLISPLHNNVLPFDSPVARVYGEIRAVLEERGQLIGDADARIASIALAHGLIVVTGNERHFRRVPGLDVENWL